MTKTLQEMVEERKDGVPTKVVCWGDILTDRGAFVPDSQGRKWLGTVFWETGDVDDVEMVKGRWTMGGSKKDDVVKLLVISRSKGLAKNVMARCLKQEDWRRREDARREKLREIDADIKALAGESASG